MQVEIIEQFVDRKLVDVGIKSDFEEQAVRLLLFHLCIAIDIYRHMTQAEKKEAIMDAFCCGSTTARNIMKQFGLTEKKYERSDYAELHAHLDEIDDRIGEAVDEISGSINCVREDISDVRDDIKQGFSNIEQLLMQKYTQNESPAKINQFDLFGL